MIAGECVRSYDEQHHKITLPYLAGKIGRVMTNAEIADLCSQVLPTGRAG